MQKSEEEVQKSFYDKIWKSVKPSYFHTPGITDWTSRLPNKFFVEFMDRFVKNYKGKNVRMLDIGCSAGRHVVYAARKGLSAYGIDFSVYAIKHCKEYAGDENLKNKTNFRVGNAIRLPFKNEQFMLINDSGCFNHIPPKHWARYLGEVYRTLKKGGVYRLKAASYKSRDLQGYDPSNESRRWFIQKDGHYKYYFKEEELRHLLRKFEIDELNERFVSKKSRFYFVICKKF